MIFLYYCNAIEPSKGEEAWEMYSPDDQGSTHPSWMCITPQSKGCLMPLESEVTVVQPPSEEHALLLEVTMADRLGVHALPHSPGTWEWSCMF